MNGKCKNGNSFKIANPMYTPAASNEPRFLDKIILKPYDKYVVYIDNMKEPFILYCLPVYENNIYNIELKNNAREITIGNDKRNDIYYSNSLVTKLHSRLTFTNDRWIIENYDTIFGTFVNDYPITSSGYPLKNGDVVFIMGLKITVIGKRLFINTPQNRVVFNKEIFKSVKPEVNIIKSEEDEDDSKNDVTLYQENEYFSRAPRITNVIEEERVKIDPPPSASGKEETPLILVLGSSLSMGAMMIVNIVSAIDRLASGTASAKQTTFSLITAGAMLVGMLLFPIITARYDRRRKKKNEIKRQKKYKEYLENKREQIEKLKESQRKILLENYPSVEECTKIILSRDPRLWERKIEDYDFLEVRWGLGDVPLRVNVTYPEEHFTLDEDNLVDMLGNIGDNSKLINMAPITTSLAEKNVCAIVKKDDYNIDRYLQGVITQLVAFHSYEDVKLVFLLSEENARKWEYVKMLPHTWNETKQIRFFADNYEDMKQISSYLEEVLQVRADYKDKNYKSFMPYYLIITDDYKKIESLRIISEMLKSKVNLGFSMLCITKDIMQLPNECKTFISLETEKNGMIFESEISKSNQRPMVFENSVTVFFEKICKILSNIPIKYSVTSGNLLPNNYSFLEMYNVGLIEGLNILSRWRKNDSTLSLKAPLGIDGSGMLIYLDIHEKFHGPHGLIAGSTGSGKSEFIITYILSLAINYHPDDVTFILIDYKGGGLAGAFQKRDIKLPHLVGTITNIDTNGLQRSLSSIQSELRRRQVLFNEARNMTDEGTIDIYKYQKLYHQGIVKKPIPHLLIICDEFAELKQQQEEFMTELMSVSRIGRSLGVHLILATQKPAGIVNGQIRSNSKFAICLKVQDKEDSNDVIKRPDAANLKKAGQFYLQVGNNEYFVLGQSAWSGATYYPSEVVTKKIDTSVQFISNIGMPIKQLEDKVEKPLVGHGEQLTNIVKYLAQVAKENNIEAENLWLEDVPDTIFVNDVREKYDIKPEERYVMPVIGEFDDPFNQRQGPVTLDFFNLGNYAIYGNAESGKETLVSTMIYDLITNYTSEQVNIYILDFGTEALKIYSKAPHVGDVVVISDDEKIERFFDMISEEIKTRKDKLTNYNGDYKLFLRTNKLEKMPTIVIALNSYEAFSEMYNSKYDDILLSLTREAVKCGIYFVITVSAHTDMRYRLSQNFKQKIALQLNKDDDYLSIFDKVGKKRPSHLFGRGLVTIDNGTDVYEFQTAKICEAENYNVTIQETIDRLIKEGQKEALAIPTIPEKIEPEDLKEYVTDLTEVPIGISKENLKISRHNFKRNLINTIIAKNIEDAAEFTGHIVEIMKNIKDLNIKVFDQELITTSQKLNVRDEYNKFLQEIIKNKSKNAVCVIIGLDKFIAEYDTPENGFGNTVQVLQALGCNFIIADTTSKLKNHEFDPWYKATIVKDTGIWVGNGIENQFSITVTSERKKLVNNCGRSYGYTVKQGEATLTKLVGMEDIEDGE